VNLQAATGAGGTRVAEGLNLVVSLRWVLANNPAITVREHLPVGSKTKSSSAELK